MKTVLFALLTVSLVVQAFCESLKDKYFLTSDEINASLLGVDRKTTLIADYSVNNTLEIHSKY